MCSSDLGFSDPIRFDITASGSVFDNHDGIRRRGENRPLDGEYRLRTAIRTADKTCAQYVNDEVLSLFCSGPAGGGGYRCNITGQVETASVLVPRGPVEARCLVEEIKP